MSFRCVHLLPDTSPAGAEIQAWYLLSSLRERSEIELELVVHGEGRLHQHFVDLDLPIHVVDRRHRLTRDFPRRVRAIRHLFADAPPDILHTWLWEGNLVGLWAARAWQGTHVVITQRSGTQERHLSWPKRRAMRALYPRADRAIANSHEGGELLKDLGLPDSSVIVIPQGVAPERIAVTAPRADIRHLLGVRDGAPLVVCAGRADEAKDFPTLIAAMRTVAADHPGAMLTLVGPRREELTAMGVDLPPFVHPVGWQDNTANFLNAADVVAIASWTEGNSNVVNEALALGRPVACTDTGDHPALVRATRGRVVPIKNAPALGDAIVALLTEPPSPDEVRAIALSKLDPDVGVRETLHAYHDLLGRAREPSRSSG